MKMSDLMHDFADFLDMRYGEKEEEEEMMIPPLQQKLELLKRAAGVENEYGVAPSIKNSSRPIIINIAGDDTDVD
jgi:hypothetical protein